MSVRRRASGRVHYNYFRDYDPAVGRYLESDPIGLSAGVNTFGYVRANPMSRIDRRGLQEIAIPWDVPLGETIPWGSIIDPVMPISQGDEDGEIEVPDVDSDDARRKELSQCPKDCRGLLRKIREHEEKLRLYEQNPDLYDNQGRLANAPTPAIRQQIIDSRIRRLRHDVNVYKVQYWQCMKNQAGGNLES